MAVTSVLVFLLSGIATVLNVFLDPVRTLLAITAFSLEMLMASVRAEVAAGKQRAKSG